MSKIIVCGSKRYVNIKFDKLVDSFDEIVRTNLLLPDDGYGLRNPTIQPINCHMWAKYKKKVPLSGWKEYIKRGVTEDYIKRFKKFIDSATDTKFVTYTRNNTSKMKNFCKKKNINANIRKEIRNGLSYVAECLSSGKKPFLIGFSLSKEDYEFSQVHGDRRRADRKINDAHHSRGSEIELITELHNKGYIDASFCCICDEKELRFCTKVITPTPRSLELAKKLLANDQCANSEDKV
tara:strand:- start:13760 stop:14470 length:711 start_codon:yes stop_codon:yes gene_type:complete